MHWTLPDVWNLPFDVYVELVAWIAETHKPEKDGSTLSSDGY